MPGDRHAFHDTYLWLLIALSIVLVGRVFVWDMPVSSALVYAGLLWASSLSVINLRSTVVLMLLPIMMTSVVKYNPGVTAVVAALGSISIQEIRILKECNPPYLFVLKILGNRASIMMCALLAGSLFRWIWPSTTLDFGSVRFLAAFAIAGFSWAMLSGFIVNFQILLSKPRFKMRIDPGVIAGSTQSLIPSLIMGLMAAAMHEYGGIILFALAQFFFISNKNYTQRALIAKENAEQINMALARIIDSKDHYTGGHSERVALLARQLAEACRLRKSDVERIEYIARLHDVGKVNLPDQILSKPGHLTVDEFDEVKRHPEWGAELIRGMANIYGDRDYRAILEHHERYDGTGYPGGKKGPEISLWARILAICDAYDAMTSERVYRSALSTDEARIELKHNSGTQFDPKLVDLFLSSVRE
ncbi:MAG: HD-GYP domain-containing protein [Bacillota bacterium]|nr:HD-GYP domain-containing protein [Bacillota bacterium]